MDLFAQNARKKYKKQIIPQLNFALCTLKSRCSETKADEHQKKNAQYRAFLIILPWFSIIFGPY